METRMVDAGGMLPEVTGRMDYRSIVLQEADLTVRTLIEGSRMRRGTSCTGGSSTKSISPDLSAAMRVAGLTIGRYTTRSALPVKSPARIPHQSGFFS